MKITRILSVGVAVSVALGVVVAGIPAQAASKVDPIRVLNSLPVSSEVGSGYSRELFRHWSDLDGDGCDTREEVLIEERIEGTVRGCVVVNGVWFSIYDGKSTSSSRTFDIDHFVPLKEAWDSGAWRWDSDTRQRFANDLAYAPSLVAVTAGSNRSKSDRDPSDWLPQRDRCTYAKSWVGVKFRWRLSVDSAEKRTLSQILRQCRGKMVLPDRAKIGTGSTSQPTAPSQPTQPDTVTDPRFRTCGEAIAAGYGPYIKGKDPEYEWYRDQDKDGSVCE